MPVTTTGRPVLPAACPDLNVTRKNHGRPGWVCPWFESGWLSECA